MEECVDGEYQTFKANDGAYVREHFFGRYPETKAMVADWTRRRDLGAPPRRPRPEEGLRRVPRRRPAHGPADGDPREDDQGLRDGAGRRGPQHHAPAEGDERGGAARDPRPARDPAHRRAGDRRVLLPAARVEPGAAVPARASQGARREPPRAAHRGGAAADAAAVHERARGQRRARELDDDGASSASSTRSSATTRSARAWCRSCPTSHGRSGWRGCSASSGSSPRSASSTSPRTPGTSCSTARTSTARSSRRASTSPARSPRGSPPRRRTRTTASAMIPFYVFYSMFGFQRVGDLAWAAGDSRARGFLIGGTAGRTTLNGEGLQHEDGHSHLLASVIPNCVAYDPTYAYEVAVIVRDGLRRMLDRAGGRLLLPHRDERELPRTRRCPRAPRRGSCEGMYLLREGAGRGAARAAPRLGLDPARGRGGRRAPRARLRRRGRRVERAELHRAAPRRDRGRALEHAPPDRGAAPLLGRRCLAGRDGPVRRGHRLHADVRRPDPAVRPRPLRRARHRRLRPQRLPRQAAAASSRSTATTWRSPR